MAEGSNAKRPELNASDLSRIDAVCDRFEAAWASGEEPEIEPFLAGVEEPLRSRLREELEAVSAERKSRLARTKNAEHFAKMLLQKGVSGGQPDSDAPAIETPHSGHFDDSTDASGSSGSRRFESFTRKRLGRFELLEELGRGAYGTVFRAHDPVLQREVAIKVPHAGVFDDPEFAQRFLREGRAAARLGHPHIVAVYETGQDDRRFFIVADLVEGETLQSKMEGGWRPSQREAATLIAELASALHYAHGQGVIHRDVKPANVMVDQAGEPHLMDFGLARRDEPDTLRTQEGVQMGTPAYMSPEQARGESHLADAQSDLWSLGVMLYELLTGNRPFEGSGLSLFDAIRTQDPRSPRKYSKAISSISKRLPEVPGEGKTLAICDMPGSGR